MTIFELGALGEFIGSIGVVATLIYLAIQIRLNTKSMDENKQPEADINGFGIRWRNLSNWSGRTSG